MQKAEFLYSSVENKWKTCISFVFIYRKTTHLKANIPKCSTVGIWSSQGLTLHSCPREDEVIFWACGRLEAALNETTNSDFSIRLGHNRWWLYNFHKRVTVQFLFWDLGKIFCFTALNQSESEWEFTTLQIPTALSQSPSQKETCHFIPTRGLPWFDGVEYRAWFRKTAEVNSCLECRGSHLNGREVGWALLAVGAAGAAIPNAMLQDTTPAGTCAPQHSTQHPALLTPARHEYTWESLHASSKHYTPKHPEAKQWFALLK